MGHYVLNANSLHADVAELRIVRMTSEYGDGTRFLKHQSESIVGVLHIQR